MLNALFLAASIQYGLPPGLLSSLCYVESKHDVNAVHVDDGPSNSLGVCQIKLETSQGLGFKGDEKQLMSPKTNIYFAAAYLKHQLVRYNGNVTKAVIAYNKGHAGNLIQTEYQAKVFAEWSKNVSGTN